MKRSTVSRQGSAFVPVAVLLLAAVVAGLADPDVAGKVSHEPRDVLETGVVLSHFGSVGLYAGPVGSPGLRRPRGGAQG